MKNRFAITFIIMLAGTFLSGYYGAWWAPSAYILIVSALLGLSARQALVAGSLSLGLVFLVMAIWMNSMDKAGIIDKTGSLLGGLSPAMMMVVTLTIGVITGLLSGWLGSALGTVLPKK